MNSETFRGRPVLSRGMEHLVLQSNPSFVTKVSRPFNFLLMLGRDQSQILRQELVEAHKLVEGTGVEIPKTHVIKGKEHVLFGIRTTSYVIGQKFVEEDGSISDKESYLAERNLDTLVEEHGHEPRNFVGNNGVLYWVDPTKGTVGRLLDNTKILNLQRYRQIRRKLSRVIRSLGL